MYAPAEKFQVGGADIDVVHVAQQAATGAVGQLVQEIDFIPIVPLNTQLMRGVFDGDAARQRVLRTRDVAGDAH